MKQRPCYNSTCTVEFEGGVRYEDSLLNEKRKGRATALIRERRDIAAPRHERGRATALIRERREIAAPRHERGRATALICERGEIATPVDETRGRATALIRERRER